jgi:NADH-quinone oxidoreductase subunit N
MAGAMRIDELTLYLNFLFAVGGIATVLLSWRAAAPRESAHGEYYCLLLVAIGGMSVLVAAQNTVTLFIGFELLSIPLYVLCATEMRRAKSLESGLKYLILGSVGSATLVYGLALLYGATGSTDFGGMARAIEAGDLASDSLLLGGVGLVIVGLAFKASIAPFHQWTPDVYEGAPTAVTAFMAVATKVAAFGVMLRLFDVALVDAQETWGPALATLAAITIIVGNVAAIGQSSLKRMLAWSSVAQAGYLLAGVVVGTQLGVRATCFYLGVYLLMNLAAFAVIIARERETTHGDHIDAVAGLGARRPLLGVCMTIAMLGLAGLPATGGFIGKFFLISAAADNGYTWLGIFIVIGSAISLAYYLRVVAAVWMRPAVASAGAGAGASGAGAGGAVSASRAPAGRPLLAGGSPEVDGTDDAPEPGPVGDKGSASSGPGEPSSSHETPGETASRTGGGPPSSSSFTNDGDEDPIGPRTDGSAEGPPADRVETSLDADTPGALTVDGDGSGHWEVTLVAVVAAAATVVAGVVPSPLFDLVRETGAALGGLL